MNEVDSNNVAELSGPEKVKLASRHLRGTLEQSLADRATGALAEDDQYLLKFHGSYQQDDRDLRLERQQQKLEPDYGYMIRARIPAGVVSAAQWLVLDEIARAYAGDSIRLTTRQTVQYHRVRKTQLKAAIQAINRALLTTVAACGDVNRNVICTVNAARSPLHAAVYQQARAISDHLLPNTGAYREIWLDGKPPAYPEAEQEPLYGDGYLPRKFKIALAVPPDNDVDVYTHDLAFIAIADGDQLAGFNVMVGGGMGMSHGDVNTYPRLASVIGFCPPDQVMEVAEQVVAIQRDYGNRTDRKRARFKYTIDDRGLPWFREELTRRLRQPLQASRPFHFSRRADQPGWQQQAGLWHWCVHLPAGRISDNGGQRYLSAFRAMASELDCQFIMTANQNLIISGLDEAGRQRVEQLASDHGIAADAGWTPTRQQALACVGLPTCALAMAESERALPAIIDRLDALMAEHGLQQTPISVRVTGCPNGCARPYVAEIGLVGKAPGRYNLYLGAAADGSRLNRLFRENIDETQIIDELRPLLAAYASKRQADESFGDYLIRAGTVRAVTEGRTFHD
ncbi:MAG: assimilatory sulfite reductase (NADPH) hemoprotein subunit [Wenzhouxiangellaceae bacterium]